MAYHQDARAGEAAATTTTTTGQGFKALDALGLAGGIVLKHIPLKVNHLSPADAEEVLRVLEDLPRSTHIMCKYVFCREESWEGGVLEIYRAVMPFFLPLQGHPPHHLVSPTPTHPPLRSGGRASAAKALYVGRMAGLKTNQELDDRYAQVAHETAW